MKTVYMQQTLTMMANGKAREVDELIASGEVKQTQDGLNYLLILT